MKKQIVIAGLSLLLISGCVTGKRDLSEMSQIVEATQDIHTAPDLGTAVSGDYIIAGDNDDAAGSRLSRIVLDGNAANCVSGAATMVPAGGTDVTLNASATTGGMSLSGQEISNRAATNAQTGYATAAQVTAQEANTTAVAGLGTASTRTAVDTFANDTTLPAGAAIKTYGDANWSTGSGDVVGPASATDNAVPRYSTTTGKLIQGSGVIVDDSNNVTGVAALTASGEIQGGSFSSPASASGPQYTLFYEDSDNGSNYIGIASQTANGNDLIWSFPTADPTAGQVMSWAAPVSVTYPAYPGTVAIDTTIGSWIDPDFLSLAVADLGDTATPHVLTTAETTNKAISNYASSGADRVFTMAVPHANGNIIFPIGDEFQVDIEPSSGQLFYLNGTAMAADEHIQNTADTLGERIVGYCVNINGTLRWMFYSSDAAWVEETP